MISKLYTLIPNLNSYFIVMKIHQQLLLLTSFHDALIFLSVHEFPSKLGALFNIVPATSPLKAAF